MMNQHCKKLFKFLFSPLAFLPLLFILTGCPYSSPYKLDNEPSIPADENLVGKWATMVTNGSGKQLPLKMTVDKRNDYEYDIFFTGNIQDLRYYGMVQTDTIKTTAFISEAASRRFLNVYVKGQSYIAEIIYRNDKISLLPLCEHFTVKMVKSNAELRLALQLHYKTRLFPLFDEEFSLREMSRVN